MRRPSSLRRTFVLAAPLAWMALIFALSSLPGRRIAAPRNWDKLAHAVEYGVLGVLATRALRELGASPWRAAAIAWAGATAFGASDEWHQSFVPGRSVEVADVLADACGAAGGAAIAALLLARRDARSALSPGAERSRGAPAG